MKLGASLVILAIVALWLMTRPRPEAPTAARPEPRRVARVVAPSLPQRAVQAPTDPNTTFEARLAREADDPAWSRAREQALASGLASLASVRSIACKRSLCRVELAHASAEAAVQFQRDFSTVDALANVDAMIVPELDARGVQIGTRMFIARDGLALVP